MVTLRSPLRLVLLQVRAHRSSLEQERRCFVERCGVDVSHFTFYNLVDDPGVRWEVVADAHAVFIGGAGDYSVTKVHPFTWTLQEIVLRLVEEGRPLFGSCWGHQFLGRALGGLVVEDPVSAEVGTYTVRLTDAGREDPLFGELPPVFDAQLGHNDRILDPGPQGLELAASARCPMQAVRFGPGPVYGTQFHSELDEHRLRERLQVYGANYVADGEEYQRILSGLRPSPAADRLLRRFLELYA